MSTKAQQKKLARKAEAQRKNEMREKIDAAESIEDYLANLPSFRKFNKNGIEADVLTFKNTPQEFLEWMFDLTKANMEEMYQQTWGWSDSKKRKELTDPQAHFIVVVTPDGPAGFLHFRFLIDSDLPLLYVYEIQVDPKFQSKGIGKQMMLTAEFIAMKNHLEAVMLTVFDINAGARRFYEKMRYITHSSTPSPGSAEAYYHVLYKPFKK